MACSDLGVNDLAAFCTTWMRTEEPGLQTRIKRFKN